MTKIKKKTALNLYGAGLRFLIECYIYIYIYIYKDYFNVVILTVTVVYYLIHINRKGWLRDNSSHFIILNLV